MDKTDPKKKSFNVGDWYADADSGRLQRQGAEVKLEPKVMKVLVYLANHPNKVVTREELETNVWTGTVVGYDAIASSVIKLRKALGDNSRNPRYIETLPKRGYRLIASVTNPAPTEMNTRDEEDETLERRRRESLNSANRTSIIAVLSIAFLALVAIATGLIPNNEKSTEDSPAAQKDTLQESSKKPSIAVLPFKNLSNDVQQEYFSDGITDDLITDLSRISGLTVIARRSAYIYKNNKGSIDTVAKELGVQYIVEGSVQRNKNNLRVNVQLVDTSTDSNLWAQRFDRNTTDIFSVQDDIRHNIINAMSITLTEEEKKREQKRYTSNFEAYDYFLQGQSALVRRASAADNNQAREFMEKAIALDPGFARAYAALALIHADAFRFNWSDNLEQTAKQAIKIGNHAVQLDPQSPQAHWILGYIYLFLSEDHDRAIELGERTLQLDPNNADAYTLLGVTHVFNNNSAQAKSLMQHLMRINPHYPSQVPSILAIANLLLAQYDEALSANDETLLINPTRMQGNVYRILILYRMGQVEDAEWQADQLMSLHPSFDANIWAERQPFKDKQTIQDMLNDLEKVGLQ